MLFILFIGLWLIIADSFVSFIIPVILISLRAAYKGRKIFNYRVWPILVALFVFISNSFLTNNTVYYNAIVSIRLVGFSVLMLHGFEGLMNNSLRFFPKIDFGMYLGFRYFPLFRNKVQDSYYVLKGRMKDVNICGKIILAFNQFNSLIYDTVRVDKDLKIVLYEKGGTPDKTSWRRVHPIENYNTFFGDIIMICFIFITYILKFKIFPMKILSIFSLLGI